MKTAWLTELIHRCFQRLRGRVDSEIDPDIEKISGLVASDVDAQAEYYERLRQKHSRPWDAEAPPPSPR